MINVYSNMSQYTLKYLKNTEVNINNVLIITGDFNIRDSLWAAWAPFSKEEFRQALVKCNNSSVPEPDKLIWRYLKIILNQDSCLSHIINIADACIKLGHWPNHFKRSSMVIIHKPNKLAYNSPKYFRPIVLLNTIGKLIEKVIAECLQFHVVKNNFIHPSQLGSLKFKSTTDTRIMLTHII